MSFDGVRLLAYTTFIDSLAGDDDDDDDDN